MIHCYQLNGYNIVLDVASGSIHCVDGVAYDAICLYKSDGAGAAAEGIREKYADLPESEISELFYDIEGLKAGGKLFSPDVFSGAAGAGRAVDVVDAAGVAGAGRAAGEKTLKALCLNVSHVCNMSCSYCFAGRGEYGGGIHDRCDNGGVGGGAGNSGGGLMSLETGKRAIDFLVENSGGRRNLDVDFFGGEPLLNWAVVKDIIGYARGIEQGSGKAFRFTLTTNGLLIDDDVIDFTCREMHNVVLSLDGRPEINNAARKLLNGGGNFCVGSDGNGGNGGGSYDVVVPKFKRLVEARGGAGYYIRGTFTRDNLDFASDILHMADLGFTELSMEPVVAAAGSSYGLSTDDLPEICGQYEALAREMLRREKEGRGFTFYHYKLDLTGGPCIYKRLAGCGVGSEYMAVTPSGELYPCHQFVGDKAFLLGDIWRGVGNGGLLDSGLRGEFAGCGILSRGECRECWARYYCSGGCAANAYHATGSINGVYKLGCEMFKKRIECAVVMKVIHNILPETIIDM